MTTIAAVVNLHDEGHTAAPSVTSAWRAVERARAHRIDAELVLMLDSASRETANLAHRWLHRGARVFETDVRDLGSARNVAADATDAEWLAFLDGDDLWAEDWLVDAYRATSTTGAGPFDVWHPQYSCIFGDHHSVIHHIGSDDPAFSFARLRLHNGWTALSFVAGETVRTVPYPRNRLDDGFGFEDWSWNIEILRRVGTHRVVPETMHFIRRRNAADESLLRRSEDALRSPYPGADGDAMDLEIPGTTTVVSELTPISDALPPTHVLAKFELPVSLERQLRAAVTIEPSIAQTLPLGARVRRLPQNTNRHVTPEQRALEQLDLACAAYPATIAEAIATAPNLLALEPDAQARVVSEVLLDPALRDFEVGEHQAIDNARRRYPQVTR